MPPTHGSRAARAVWITLGGILAIATLGWGTYNVISILAHEEYTQRSTFAVGEVSALDVRNESGSVTITATPGDTVTVVAEVSDGWQTTDLSIGVVDGVLELRADCPCVRRRRGAASTSPSRSRPIARSRSTARGTVRVRGMAASVDIDSDDGRHRTRRRQRRHPGVERRRPDHRSPAHRRRRRRDGTATAGSSCRSLDATAVGVRADAERQDRGGRPRHRGPLPRRDGHERTAAPTTWCAPIPNSDRIIDLVDRQRLHHRPSPRLIRPADSRNWRTNPSPRRHDTSLSDASGDNFGNGYARSHEQSGHPRPVHR